MLEMESPDGLDEIGRSGGAAVVQSNAVFLRVGQDRVERLLDQLAGNRALVDVAHAQVDVDLIPKVGRERGHHAVDRRRDARGTAVFG